MALFINARIISLRPHCTLSYITAECQSYSSPRIKRSPRSCTALNNHRMRHQNPCRRPRLCCIPRTTRYCWRLVSEAPCLFLQLLVVERPTSYSAVMRGKNRASLTPPVRCRWHQSARDPHQAPRYEGHLRRGGDSANHRFPLGITRRVRCWNHVCRCNLIYILIHIRCNGMRDDDLSTYLAIPGSRGRPRQRFCTCTIPQLNGSRLRFYKTALLHFARVVLAEK